MLTDSIQMMLRGVIMKIYRLGLILLLITAASNPLHAVQEGKEDGASPEHECDLVPTLGILN